MKNKLTLIVVTFLVIGISVIFIAKTMHLDRGAYFNAIAKFQLTYCLAALAAAFFQTIFQINRLWVLFPKEAKLKWAHTARAFTYGQFLNTFGPNGAGDVLKVVLTRKHEDKQGRQVEASESSAIVFVVDKLADVGSIILLTLIALLQAPIALPEIEWNKHVRLILLGAIVLSLVFYILFFGFRKRSGAIAQWIEGFKVGLQALREPKRFSSALLMGAGNSLSKVIALHILCVALGFSLSYPELVFSILILNLGISVPISPGNLGVYEASLAFALSKFGAPMAESLAIATVHHACQMIEIAVLALLFWLHERWQDWQRESKVQPVTQIGK
ncbi:hypothetical protein NIES593_11155 [Hydrococcus rivularis NIES-593]|uniref:TIGR00374 family protein n=1 Tax=Hydrococcus rivularis NIES-593 TaxID=1921803 RepID=A0A1U7HHI6_9CYAN|nr:lysylphosphatidylglycerol synthase transmembrane domain-containing protein [Hydrococcus rivularis]OKH23015.1 hypothetical protein NIES593_11155 [Hydrococcus rivularis NIES-593]